MSESIKELRRICQASRENELFQMSWTSKHIFRKLSIYFTKLFLITKISANQVTFLGLLVGIIAAVFLTFGNPIYWIAAALLLYLFLILDLVDGEIARYNKTASVRGAFWDTISGLFVWQFILVCASFGIYRALHEVIVLVFGFAALALLFLYNVSTLLSYPILHEKGLLPEALLPEAIKDKHRKNLKGTLRYGRAIFGQGGQGLFHGILVTSVIDCFVSLPAIAGFSLNFRFLYLIAYVAALLIGVMAKIYDVHRRGVRIMRF